VSDPTEVLTAVWSSCLLKADGNILVGRYDVHRRSCNSTLKAALFRKLIFQICYAGGFDTQLLKCKQLSFGENYENFVRSVGHMSCDAGYLTSYVSHYKLAFCCMLVGFCKFVCSALICGYKRTLS